MLSVLVSCTFLFAITHYIPSTVAISIPLTVDAVCSFLLFFVNEESVCTCCTCLKLPRKVGVVTEHASDHTNTSKVETEVQEVLSRKFKITSQGNVVYEQNSVREYSHKESREQNEFAGFEVNESEMVPMKQQREGGQCVVSQISYTEATLKDTSCVATVLFYEKTI